MQFGGAKIRNDFGMFFTYLAILNLYEKIPPKLFSGFGGIDYQSYKSLSLHHHTQCFHQLWIVGKGDAGYGAKVAVPVVQTVEKPVALDG